MKLYIETVISLKNDGKVTGVRYSELGSFWEVIFMTLLAREFSSANAFDLVLSVKCVLVSYYSQTSKGKTDPTTRYNAIRSNYYLLKVFL